MDEALCTFQGFLYKPDEENWILCDAPNLKSCCLQKHAVVTLEGDFSRYSLEKAVTVKGIYHANGHLLSEVSVVEKNGHTPYWTLGILLVSLALWMTFKSWRGRPLPP
ncbi:MAG: hypothetical protein S4CHLAM2_03350 [Chlamydiales bacterium]|nr:hypothetical protein [Chlamydiales bacterium]